MVTILGLLLVLILAGPGQAQTYSRCVDAAGKIYLTEGPPPAGIRCPVAVVSLTRSLQIQVAARGRSQRKACDSTPWSKPRRSPFPCHPDESAWQPTPGVAVVEFLNGGIS